MKSRYNLTKIHRPGFFFLVIMNLFNIKLELFGGVENIKRLLENNFSLNLVSVWKLPLNIEIKTLFCYLQFSVVLKSLSAISITYDIWLWLVKRENLKRLNQSFLQLSTQKYSNKLKQNISQLRSLEENTQVNTFSDLLWDPNFNNSTQIALGRCKGNCVRRDLTLTFSIREITYSIKYLSPRSFRSWSKQTLHFLLKLNDIDSS